MRAVAEEKVHAELLESGALLRLILDRPVGNIVTSGLMEQLGHELALHESDPHLRLVTIEGARGHFSYGASVEEHRKESAPGMLRALSRLVRGIARYPAPVAALVEGRCLGGGFELALACDDIIATDSATFGFPEIRLAAFAPAAAAILPLRVGASRAARAIITGHPQPSQYWHDAGLVSMVAPQADLLAAAASWFDTHLAPRSAVALSHAALATRLTLRAQAEPALDRAERDYLGGLLKSADAVEGITAWLEKRPPNWKNT